MFDSYIAYQARLRPDAPAVATLQGSASFAKLDADIDRAVPLLRRLAPASGEAVCVDIVDPYLHWVLVLALARSGIASAPATDRASTAKVSDRADDDHTNTLLIGLAEVERILSGPRPSIPPVRPNEEALGRILKSSGTTGEEKRLGMSWRVIDSGIRNALVAYGAPDGPWLASTGINTILGLVVSLACWASGNPVVLGLGGELPPADLARLRPRLIALVPHQLRQLLHASPPDPERWPLRIVSGGGPVPPALAARTRQLLTSDLRSVYGAAETGAVAVADLAMLERQEGAAGYVLPRVDVQIVDEHDAPTPCGELGQVRIRSDRAVDHYLDDPERSSDAFRNGWFYPGDLGRLQADGLLLIDGRFDDVMNLGGHKVLPGWVEKAALGCAGISDAGAFSMRDKDGLDQCWLAIVPNEDFSTEALAGALSRQLGWLEKINWMSLEAIPRNQMGKVERLRLRRLAEGLEPSRS